MIRKFVLLALLLALYETVALAQSSIETNINLRNKVEKIINKYLTVKGLELKPGLEMKDALQHFESKGASRSEYFDMVKSEYGIYDLKGTFFSRRNCSIRIVPTANNKAIVGIISINFPDGNSFKKLKEEYDILKSSLKEKYYIFSSKESFDNDYINETTSDYLKLSALSKDEGLFETRFYVSDNEASLLLGQIVLKISHVTVDYQTTYYVSLTYSTSDDIIEQLSSQEDDL